MRASLRQRNWVACLLSLLLSIAAGAHGSAHAESIGTAGASNRTSTGKPPGQAIRTIEIGTQIVRNEKVDTSATGNVQVVFIDKTTLNIGPNSSLVIDEFVYSPVEASGKMVLTLGKGVLRVVGGQATHTGGAIVNTPVATIGIRGGIATIGYCAAAGTGCTQTGLRVTNNFGQITVTAGGASQIISRPGFTLTVDAVGSAPSAPFKTSQAQVNQDNGLLTSGAGQTGGSSTIPTDSVAQQKGVGRTDAALVPALSAPRQGQTISTAQTSSNGTGSVQGQITALNKQLIQTAVTQPAVAQTATTIIASNPTPGVNPVLNIKPVTTLNATAYALTTTVDQSKLGQGQVPYLLASFVGQGNWNVSPILGYRAGGTQTSPFSNGTSRILQAAINISGTGAAQSSGLLVATAGIVFDNQYGFTQVGGFDASRRLNATGGVIQAGGGLSSPANTASPAAGSVPVDSDLLPTGSYASNQNYFATSNSGNVHTYTPANANQSGAQSYQFDQTVTRITTPTGLGTDHPDETLQGYVGGLGRTTTFVPISGKGQVAPAFLVTNATGTPGDVNIVLPGNSSRMGATFNVVASTPSTTGPPTSAVLNFGSLSSADDSVRGTYIDTRNFGARSEHTFTASNGSYTTAETSTVGGQNVIQGSEDGFQLLMVTSDTVLGTSATNHTSSLFPGVSFCACDYTRWGFWSARSYRQNDAADTAVLNAGNLLTWVAGLPAGASDIPTVGTASYAGHVIADISNNGAQYVAASNFTNTVNFATGTGAVVVPNLDGASYSGNVSFNSGNRALFGGSIPGFATSARTMALNGAFFRSATSPYGEMGGSVTLTGANYLGGGIFAAHAR